MATATITLAADQHWNAQLGIERCGTLVRALEHELEGNHASLVAMLRREIEAIDKYVSADQGAEASSDAAEEFSERAEDLDELANIKKRVAALGNYRLYVTRGGEYL